MSEPEGRANHAMGLVSAAQRRSAHWPNLNLDRVKWSHGCLVGQ